MIWESRILNLSYRHLELTPLTLKLRIARLAYINMFLHSLSDTVEAFHRIPNILGVHFHISHYDLELKEM